MVPSVLVVMRPTKSRKRRSNPRNSTASSSFSLPLPIDPQLAAIRGEGDPAILGCAEGRNTIPAVQPIHHQQLRREALELHFVPIRQVHHPRRAATLPHPLRQNRTASKSPARRFSTTSSPVLRVQRSTPRHRPGPADHQLIHFEWSCQSCRWYSPGWSPLCMRAALPPAGYSPASS